MTVVKYAAVFYAGVLCGIFVIALVSAASDRFEP